MFRRLALLLIGSTLLAACATGARPAASRSGDPSPAPRRCSPADPDRWAWFCVIGQILYGAASFFQPIDERTIGR